MLKPRRNVLDLEPGELLNGTVTIVDNKTGIIFADVGVKRNGTFHTQQDAMLLPGQLTAEFNASLTEPIQPGFTLSAWVKDVRDDGKFALMTFSPKAPKRPLEEMVIGETLQGIVRKMPSFGGAFIDVGFEKNGWLPPYELDEGPLLDPLEVGQKMDVWVKECTKEKGVLLTLSKPRQQLTTLKAGQMVSGTITGFSKFGGIFVDIGAVRDGLVNPSDAAAGSDQLNIGHQVTAWVKQRTGDWRLQLTLVRPKVSSRVIRGQAVRGRITGVNHLGGAFVDIGSVNDALVRWEEMTPEVQKGPVAEVLLVGQEVDLWVKDTHRDGKIDLTMKDPKAEAAPAPRRRGIV
eukprot:UN0371